MSSFSHKNTKQGDPTSFRLKSQIRAEIELEDFSVKLKEDLHWNKLSRSFRLLLRFFLLNTCLKLVGTPGTWKWALEFLGNKLRIIISKFESADNRICCVEEEDELENSQLKINQLVAIKLIHLLSKLLRRKMRPLLLKT